MLWAADLVCVLSCVADIYNSYDGQDKMLLNTMPQEFAEANRTLPNYVAFVLQVGYGVHYWVVLCVG